MYTLEGASSVANFIAANEEYHFLVYRGFFVSKGNFFTFIDVDIIASVLDVHFEQKKKRVNFYVVLDVKL